VAGRVFISYRRADTANQAARAGAASNQPTVAGMAPSWGPPAVHAAPSQPPPGQTRPMRRRPKPLTIALIAGAAVVAAVVAFIAIPSGHPASPSASSSPASAAGSHRASAPKTSNSPSAAASAKVLLADDFATSKAGWVDDAHASAGAYTGSGVYRLSVTGYNGQNELARPSSAGSGLSGVTPLNLDVSVDVRTLSGAGLRPGPGVPRGR
jgi:hypothetical protein